MLRPQEAVVLENARCCMSRARSPADRSNKSKHTCTRTITNTTYNYMYATTSRTIGGRQPAGVRTSQVLYLVTLDFTLHIRTVTSIIMLTLHVSTVIAPLTWGIPFTPPFSSVKSYIYHYEILEISLTFLCVISSVHLGALLFNVLGATF